MKKNPVTLLLLTALLATILGSCSLVALLNPNGALTTATSIAGNTWFLTNKSLAFRDETNNLSFWEINYTISSPSYYTLILNSNNTYEFNLYSNNNVLKSYKGVYSIYPDTTITNNYYLSILADNITNVESMNTNVMAYNMVYSIGSVTTTNRMYLSHEKTHSSIVYYMLSNIQTNLIISNWFDPLYIVDPLRITSEFSNTNLCAGSSTFIKQ